jgi:asparagine synthase (glutamine-hydrolysing)
MCGIAGVYNLNKMAIDQEKLIAMTEIVSHRGPDDEGYLLVNTDTNSILQCYGNSTLDNIKSKIEPIPNVFKADLAFGFRRLSIIDVSENGHQPMSNFSGNIWIIFNGEIYNYIELKEELVSLGHKFKSNSDTEVIIEAYEQWGESCLNRFNGMWAFAIWDNKKKILFCARDRFGIKPFHYYFDGTNFIFASEIKQILEWRINKEINEEVIYKSFSIGGFLINSNSTYFKNIKILPHSHYMIISDNNFKIKRYYDLDITLFEKSNLSFQDASIKYRSLFIDAVKLRMRSDVEVGSALSGGLDSSAIVGVASGFTKKRFKTFTSYYPIEEKFDERKWVDLVVKRTNAIPYYTTKKVDEIIEDLYKITWFHDYPLIGSSPIAQYYVMQLAKNNDVSVLLDGQGSDEILGGYRHAFYRYYADTLKKIEIKNLCKEFPSYLTQNNSSVLNKLLNTNLSLFFDERTLYKNEARFAFNPLVIDSNNIEYNEIKNIKTSKLSNFLYNQIMSTSIQTLLHFEDRNAMANSIESRVPFLDFRLVEFVFSLPSKFKIHNNLGKYIHRNSLQSLVPSEILNRNDKLGFLTPGEFYWMRNEMKPIFLELINSPSFKNRNIYNHKLINKEFSLYLKGKNKHAQKLWMVMALEIWFKNFID